MKVAIKNDNENPHQHAYNQIKSEEQLDPLADAFIDSSSGRTKSAKIKSRIKSELAENEEIIDGLPHFCRFIDGSRFYNEKLNKGAKFNKFFMLESELIMSFLKTLTEFSFVKG